MANTVGNHTVATFTAPVNGTSPIDADQVRSNDNTLRSSYNSHDQDPGIHVQSSTLALRLSAGTAGRKWITADSGDYRLWYDDGSRWHEVGSDAVNVEFVASADIVKGDVLKLTGWNNGLNLPELAPATVSGDVCFAISDEGVLNGARGYAINTGFIEDLDTSAFSVGDVLYPSNGAGPGTITSWFQNTKPTSGNYQISAYVIRSNPNNGVLFVEFSGPHIVERSDNTAGTVVLRDGSGNFSAGTVTASLSGNVTGNLTGNVTGDLTGNVTGNVVGNVTGDLTGNVTGNVTGSVTGNADTATALQTSRTIWGQSFDGTANVTGNISGVGTTEINSVTYTWPASDGNSNDYLSTDGSGNLSWVTHQDTIKSAWIWSNLV